MIQDVVYYTTLVFLSWVYAYVLARVVSRALIRSWMERNRDEQA